MTTNSLALDDSHLSPISVVNSLAPLGSPPEPLGQIRLPEFISFFGFLKRATVYPVLKLQI